MQKADGYRNQHHDDRVSFVAPKIRGPPGATYFPSHGAGNLNTLNKVCMQVLK